jgi:hypothetical protein
VLLVIAAVRAGISIPLVETIDMLVDSLADVVDGRVVNLTAPPSKVAAWLTVVILGVDSSNRLVEAASGSTKIGDIPAVFTVMVDIGRIVSADAGSFGRPTFGSIVLLVNIADGSTAGTVVDRPMLATIKGSIALPILDSLVAEAFPLALVDVSRDITAVRDHTVFLLVLLAVQTCPPPPCPASGSIVRSPSASTLFVLHGLGVTVLVIAAFSGVVDSRVVLVLVLVASVCLLFVFVVVMALFVVFVVADARFFVLVVARFLIFVLLVVHFGFVVLALLFVVVRFFVLVVVVEHFFVLAGLAARFFVFVDVMAFFFVTRVAGLVGDVLIVLASPFVQGF